MRRLRCGAALEMITGHGKFRLGAVAAPKRPGKLAD
jgi:hypothetical protein